MRCAPLAKRSERGAAGSAMRLTSSTHGPVALTTQVALTASAPPPSTSVQSAPATRPPASRSAPTSTRVAMQAPASAAARATVIVMRASLVS